QRDRALEQLLATQARRAFAEGTSLSGVELGATLALESIQIARKNNRMAEADAVEVARSALLRLPLIVLSHGSPVGSLAVLADGRLASGAEDGTIKLWPMDSTEEPAVLSQGRPISRLAALVDGRLASSWGGEIKVWPKDGVGEPSVISHGEF